MKYVICGGRDFAMPSFHDVEVVKEHWEFLCRSLENILFENESRFRSDVTDIYHGDCRGADKTADLWVRKCGKGHIITTFPADWATHHVHAGPIRNKEMAQAAGQGSGLIAFWNGQSHGTKDMIRQAHRAKFTEIHIYRY